jgi:diguanylate cyclase (GGDEF)-like protein/PAS domain S-box-containing protein
MAELGAGVRSKAGGSGVGRESLLARALDLVPRSAAAVLDRDYRIIEAFGETFSDRGYDTEAMIGLRITDVLLPETVEPLEPRLEAALDGESSSFEMRSSDGQRCYIMDTRPIVIDGEVEGVFAFATEITGRKRAEALVAQEKQLFEDVLDSIGQMISVKDPDRNILYINRCLEDYLGIDREEAFGGPFDPLIEAEMATTFARDDREVLDSGQPIRVERQAPVSDGSLGTFLTERAPLKRPDGSVYGIVTVAADISDRITAEEQLSEARKRFETAFENAPNGMALVGIDGRFLRVNPAMCDLTGYRAEELLTLRVADITHRDDMEEQVELVQRALAGEFDSYALEKRFTKKTGGIVWLMLAVSLVRDESGQPLYVIAQTTNISANKRVEADLRSEAGQDPLTELANRRQIERAIGARIERAGQTGEQTSLLMMDLDDFKCINDHHGHEAGDAVLRFFAEALRQEVRESDLPGRLGGDEFVVLMRGVDDENAERISKQLMGHFDRLTFEPEGLALPVRVSVGHAQIETGSESPASVMAAADRSMYKVKRSKKLID